MRSGTISQVKIDERLVRDAVFLRKSLKIAYSAFIHPESYLTLEPAGIRVFLSLGKIVFFSHIHHLSQ
jgi:hypothetical protein